MATYKGIQGYAVQTLSSDPTADTDTVGQLWYNSTGSPTSDGAFKLIQSGAGAWSAGGTMNTATRGAVSAGSQTASLVAGGDSTASEEYDGTSWTAGNAMNNPHPQTSGGGTQTAAWCQSGPSVTELYNGTTWSNQPSSSITQKPQRGGCGTQTSALLAGGEPRTSNAEIYDGSTWTAITAYPLTLRYPEAVGATNTAVITFGGDSPGGMQTAANSWNGSSWTGSPAMNTSRFEFASLGASSTSAMAMGGDTPGRTLNVEDYDGSSWTEIANVSAINAQATGAGTTTAGLFVFGMSGPPPGTTPGASEEYNDPNYQTKILTES